MVKWTSMQKDHLAPTLRYGSATPASIDRRFLTHAQIAKLLRCSITDVWQRIKDFDEQWRRRSNAVYRPARQGRRGADAEKSDAKCITAE